MMTTLKLTSFLEVKTCRSKGIFNVNMCLVVGESGTDTLDMDLDPLAVVELTTWCDPPIDPPSKIPVLSCSTKSCPT